MLFLWKANLQRNNLKLGVSPLVKKPGYKYLYSYCQGSFVDFKSAPWLRITRGITIRVQQVYANLILPVELSNSS